MSWQENNKMSLKKSFVSQAQSGTIRITTLCERFNISRQTGYKWLRRYEALGDSGLEESSRKPLNSPNSGTHALKEMVFKIREQHPCWGGRKIREILLRNGCGNAPASSTISGWLKAAGYINKNGTDKVALTRFERDRPNSLWQSDFKGHFAFEQGRCHPLTILDDHSRYCIGIKASEKETGDVVKKAYIEVFKRYGQPEQINFDNGPPWGSLFAACRYTTFSLWLIEHGVKVTFSAPYHPQTNGKIERFHRTLKSEVITPSYFSSLAQIQETFNDWRNIYNYERPHEALEMDIPSNRYKPSYRQYNEVPGEFEYAEDYQLKKVDTRGRVKIDGRTIFIGVPFAKRVIGIRNKVPDNTKEFFYKHQNLGEMDISVISKSEGINLHTGEILRV